MYLFGFGLLKASK